MEQARLLLQSLLAERFHLKVRHRQKELSVYNLVVAKAGPKMQPALDDPSQNPHAQRVSMEDIVRFVSSSLDRPLIDKTGLAGLYLVSWSKVQHQIVASAVPGENGALLSGVEEALGLKAEPAKVPVDTLVIEGADRPTED